MSVLTLKVDEVMRTLSAESSNPFVVHDKEVDIVRFAINSGFADIVLDGQVALRVMYQRPGETEVRAQTLVYYDTDGLHNYYDWQLSQSDLAKNGSLMVALCILDISGGEVSEWHTTPCEVRVLSTIHTDDSDEGDDTITPTVKERVAVLETMIQRVASGAPIVVSSTSAMTDTNQIYVLSTNGRWYYHNGTTWVSGGTYGAVATDTTLTQAGIPADAKAVGDEISAIKADLGDISEETRNMFSGEIGVTNGMIWDNGTLTNTSVDGRTQFYCIVRFRNDSSDIIVSTVEVISASARYAITLTPTSDGDNIQIVHNGGRTNLTASLLYRFEANQTYTVSFNVDGYNPSVVGGLDISKIQIELGDTATEYIGHTTNKLADGVVTTAKIADGAITAGKLASGAVPTDTTLTQPGIPADAKTVGDAINAVTSDVEEVQDALDHLDVETDKTLSVDGKPADAKKTGDEISELKADLSEIADGVFGEQDLSPTASPSGYRLNANDGLCSSDSSYKLAKWLVSEGANAGTVFHIHSDDRWQFQSVASVPSTGTSNRVGKTYGTGDYYVEVPSGATYIIGSTPTSGSTFKVYRMYSLAKEAFESSCFDSPLYTLGRNTLLTNSAYLRQDGQIVSNNYYKTSDYIAVKSGQIIKYKLSSTTTTAVICFFKHKKEQNSFSYVAGAGSLDEGTFTVPSDGYIRFATEIATMSEAYCYIEADLNPNFDNPTAQDKVFVGKKIVVFGDSIMADSSCASVIADITGATVYNCAIGGSMISYTDNYDYTYGIISGVRIAKGIDNDNLDEIDVSGLGLSYGNTQRWNRLLDIDFNDIDMAVVSYGTNDFSYNQPLDSDTPFDESAIKTSVDYFIKVMNTKYPNIQLCFFTPSYRHRTAWSGDSDEVTNGIGKYLADYEDAIYEACQENHVPCKKMYHSCGVNKYNYETYLSDGLHRTDAGGELLGHQYTGFLENNVI